MLVYLVTLLTHNAESQNKSKNDFTRILRFIVIFEKNLGKMSDEQKLSFIYDENSAKPKEEDYLLGKAVDANYEKGTMGQINAVEYGKQFFF